MPRYLIAAASADEQHVELAIALTARRYPEVAIERCFEADDGHGPHDFWLCTAPSEAHIQRWASESDLALRNLCVTTDRADLGARTAGDPDRPSFTASPDIADGAG